MAKASKETIVIRPAQEAIAAKPAITEDVIHLQLSKEEAQALRTVLGGVGGSMYGSDRKYCDNVLDSLQNLGINSDLKSLNSIDDTINFKDWSEYKDATPVASSDAIAEKQEENGFKFKLGERVWIPEWEEYGTITALPSKDVICYEVEGYADYYYCLESELHHAPSNR